MKYSFLISVVLAVVIGYMSSIFIFNNYDDALAMSNNRDVYFLKSNECSNYDTYLKIDDQNCYIGLTKNIDNIQKIKSYYDEDISIDKKIINDNKFNDLVDKYDLLISNSDNRKEISSVFVKLVSTYKEYINEN